MEYEHIFWLGVFAGLLAIVIMRVTCPSVYDPPRCRSPRLAGMADRRRDG